MLQWSVCSRTALLLSLPPPGESKLAANPETCLAGHFRCEQRSVAPTCCSWASKKARRHATAGQKQQASEASLCHRMEDWASQVQLPLKPTGQRPSSHLWPRPQLRSWAPTQGSPSLNKQHTQAYLLSRNPGFALRPRLRRFSAFLHLTSAVPSALFTEGPSAGADRARRG